MTNPRLIDVIKRAVARAKLDAHPVGSLYCSVDSTDPSELFGGAWERVAQGRALWGADAAHSGGDTINAGLPNITGSLGAAGAVAWQDPAGCFYTGGSEANAATADSGALPLPVGAGFDASRSSAIYGNSSTVQPPAYVVYMWRRTA